MPRPIEMTRQQLYDLVWSMPMRNASASIPMAHPSLKKVCLKHEVPVPPLGHWRKSRARQEADKIPLPAITMGEQRIWVKRFLQLRSANPPSSVQRAEADPGLEAPASDQDGARWHGCTRRTESALKQATPDKRGALIAAGVGVAPINVAPETGPRALAVLDALIRAVERLGRSISVRSSPAAFVINGEQVPVAISERFVRSDGPADAAEMMRRKSYERRYPKYFQRMSIVSLSGWTHRPTGKLTITLGDGYERGLQRLWADGTSGSVESRVDEVAAEAIAHAEAIGVRRRRIDLRVAERRESEQQRQKREMEGDRQSKRVAFFKERADMLEEAERLDRFLQHVRRTSDYPSVKMHEFLTWADAYVADLRERCGALAVDADLAGSELW